MVTRVRARAKRLGHRSIVAAARMAHPLRVSRPFIRRCLRLHVLNPIAMRTMMPRVPSLVPELIIR